MGSSFGYREVGNETGFVCFFFSIKNLSKFLGYILYKQDYMYSIKNNNNKRTFMYLLPGLKILPEP